MARKPAELTKVVTFRTTPVIADAWAEAVKSSGALNYSDWLRQQISTTGAYRIDDAGLAEMLIRRADYQDRPEIVSWLREQTKGRAAETGISRKARKTKNTTTDEPIKYDPYIRKQIRGACINLNQLAHAVNSNPYLTLTNHEELISALGRIEESINRSVRAIRSTGESHGP